MTTGSFLSDVLLVLLVLSGFMLLLAVPIGIAEFILSRIRKDRDNWRW